jgi:hypothetical protein
MMEASQINSFSISSSDYPKYNFLHLSYVRIQIIDNLVLIKYIEYMVEWQLYGIV